MATQAIATTDQAQPPAPAGSAEQQHFALMQRKAAIYASSPLIPDALRNGPREQALANCYIALSIAERMQENELTVLQNIHIVKGKAGFSAQFMIARANASGVFKGRINWRMSGAGDTLAAEAFATLADTGEEVSFVVDMAMAKAEGWTSNPKYKSVPHLMLRYRSATFLVRLYAPDVMFGYRTAEEVEDMGYVDAVPDEPKRLTAAMISEQAKGEPANDGTLSADNPAATEGRADEQHGDQHPGDDADDDEPKANALIARIEAATVLGDVIAIEGELKAADLAPDQAKRVADAAQAARARFGK